MAKKRKAVSKVPAPVRQQSNDRACTVRVPLIGSLFATRTVAARDYGWSVRTTDGAEAWACYAGSVAGAWWPKRCASCSRR